MIDTELSKIIESWLQWLRLDKRYSGNTLDAYARDFNNFTSFLYEYREQMVTKDTLLGIDVISFRAWLAVRRKNGVKAVSNTRGLSVIRNFFRYIHRYHGLDNQAVFYVTQPIRRRHLPKALSIVDANEAISEVKLHNKIAWMRQRDVALLFLLYGAGLRISEALSLKKKDAFCDELRITGKSNKERVVPLLPAVKQQLVEYTQLCPYLIQADASHHLFLSKFGKKLQRTNFAGFLQMVRSSSTLPDHLTPHTFRHSFATQLLNNGVDIRFIQELLGHSELATTQIYASLDDNTMVKSYQKFHPQSRKSLDE